MIRGTPPSDPDSDGFVDDSEQRQEILEDRDEYIAENVFLVPEGARWSRADADPDRQGLLQAASRPDIGERIDRALELIERENDQLRGVLPRIYARAPLSAERLGKLVETIGRIRFGASDEQARDYLGCTYEYFIKEFASSEGKRGGGRHLGERVERLPESSAFLTRLTLPRLRPSPGH